MVLKLHHLEFANSIRPYKSLFLNKLSDFGEL